MANPSSDVNWVRALNVVERAASLRRENATHLALPKADLDRGSRRLERWRSQRPFDGGEFFQRRLALNGLSENDLLYLLAETAEMLASRVMAPPAWATCLDSHLALASSHPTPEHGVSTTPVVGSSAGWLPVLMPLLRQAGAQLRSGLQNIKAEARDHLIDAGRAEDLFLPGLALRLVEIAERTMVLELNVARLKGLLRGDTAEARFRSFVQHVSASEVRAELLREYSVLARLLSSAVELWLECTLELARHLCEDWPALREAFSLMENPGALVKINACAGDRHRGGRAVAVLEFSSGLRLVYKPRSLSVDVHFQQLLDWFNARGQNPPLRTIRILDRGDHGWSEYVEQHECESVEALRRFYQRQGCYLAILHLLHATDFHFENIVAAGEHPVLVDLESLFHPHFLSDQSMTPGDTATSILGTSVLRVSMLPSRWSLDDSTVGIDVSGLGTPEGQLLPHPEQFWQAPGTDTMRLERKPKRMSGGAHRPRLHGHDADVTEFQEEVTAGFSAAYRMIMRHRDELRAPNGPLVAFSEDEVRVVLRPTRLYDALLRESYHPDMLRDGLDRDRFFDRLWVSLERTPYLEAVIEAERADLWRDDIPRFTTRPHSTDVWCGSAPPIHDFFARSGLSLALQRLESLSEDDLRRQQWLVRASFTALAASRNSSMATRYAWSGPTAPVPPQRFLDMAVSVGDHLANLALWGSGGASWIGLKPVQERYWMLSSLGLDLYSGLPGVALFYAYLSAASGGERFLRLAQGALTTILHQVNAGVLPYVPIGAFSGWGGLLYALAHLQVLCDRPELGDVIQKLITMLPKQIEQEHRFDLMGGLAGCLVALLRLRDAEPTGTALSLAVRCGDRLIAAARPMKHGLGWSTPLGPEPLAGFSHGGAGIAWTLAALWGATGFLRFRDAAIAAIEYERGLFSPEAENWRDLRDAEGASANLSAWCHGAVGVGIGRIGMLPYLDTPHVRAEIDLAVRRTITRGFGNNHSLCHGDLGAIELMLLARQVGVLSAGDQLVERLGATVLESIEANGCLCGVPGGVETPGLMNGLAGIGFGLLRLARPTLIPSVLTLEASPQAGTQPRSAPPAAVASLI